jgi:N-acetylglucosamine transport system substrate-binding protein
MEEQSFTHNFGWGMTTLPATSVDNTAYSYCTVEQIWIPADAEKKSEAEQFVAFLYSDEAAKLFVTKGAVQPIKNSSSIVDGSAKRYYSLFDNGEKAALGTAAVNSVLADSFGKLVDGTIKSGEFLATVKAAGAQ